MVLTEAPSSKGISVAGPEIDEEGTVEAIEQSIPLSSWPDDPSRCMLMSSRNWTETS